MIASCLRASLARARRVNSAVSDTPVRFVASARWPLTEVIAAQLYRRSTLSSVRRLRVVVDDL